MSEEDSDYIIYKFLENPDHIIVSWRGRLANLAANCIQVDGGFRHAKGSAGGVCFIDNKPVLAWGKDGSGTTT